MNNFKTSNSKILSNKVTAANFLFTELNLSIPKILAELNKGFKLKNDGSFDKRTKEKIEGYLTYLREKI